jgi:hypothetical protein
MSDNLILLPNSVYSNLIAERMQRIQSSGNRFIILQSHSFAKNYISFPNIEILSYANNYREIINGLGPFKKIIVNLHDEISAHFVSAYKKSFPDCKIIWILWGADLYYLPAFIKKVGTPLSQPYINSSFPSGYKRKCKNLVKYSLGMPNAITLHNSYQHFDAIATIVKEDYDKAVEYFGKNFEFIKYSHLSLTQMFDNGQSVERPTANHILIGNSGDPANNHLEILLQLKEFKLDRIISCPLSYGDKVYISAVLHSGKELLGKQFVPITTFLPTTEYYDILKSCSHAIFNHNIQQAYGNIVGLLWNGTKVFLNEHNTLYAHFKEMGVQIFSIQQHFNIDELNKGLSDDIISHNKEVLAAQFSDEKVDNYYSNLMAF